MEKMDELFNELNNLESLEDINIFFKYCEKPEFEIEESEKEDNGIQITK